MSLNQPFKRPVSSLPVPRAHDDNSCRQQIEILSQRSSLHHLHPGTDLINLNQYFSPRTGFGIIAEHPGYSPENEDATAYFALIHDVRAGNNTRFGSSLAALNDFRAYNKFPASCLVFLRGYAPPEWLDVVGNKFDVAPELYRRHLRYQAFSSGVRDLYTSPSLPSSSARVFQLTIPTICTRNVGGSGYQPEDLREDRRSEAEAMGRYFKHLRNRANVADSIVRSCLLLSKQEYVVEQNISIEVGPPSDKWRIIVWLDNGKDLSQSPHGPWSPLPGTQSWETYFFPIIVPSAIDASTAAAAAAKLDSQIAASQPTLLRASDSPKEDWRAAQNICLLPIQYGQQLDKEMASQDAMYALSEIFNFAAAAKVQFLNLLQKRIDHELSLVGKENFGKYHSISLLNLRYIKTSLTQHAQSLSETVAILQNRHLLNWPRAPDSEIVDRAAELLLADFQDLHRRAVSLSRECEQGMTTIANSTILEESRLSAEVAARVQRLTLMATVFIPLSFVCSIWGMNFKEIGSGALPMWWWCVSAAPVLGLSLLIYHLAR